MRQVTDRPSPDVTDRNAEPVVAEHGEQPRRDGEHHLQCTVEVHGGAVRESDPRISGAAPFATVSRHELNRTSIDALILTLKAKTHSSPRSRHLTSMWSSA
jgi:hypothetical protein